MNNEYWIVFTSGKHWITRFLKRQYGHVFLITKDDFNWMKINPGFDRTEPMILNVGYDFNVPQYLSSQGNKVVHLRTGSPRLKLGRWHIRTCVKECESILGIKLQGLTPWRAYKKLAKMANDPEVSVKKGFSHICVLT